MKLLQLNMWHGKLLPQIIELVQKHDPDIICMQEVSSCKYTIIPMDQYFNALELLLEATPYSHVFFSPTFSTDIAKVSVSHGNAILSKHPLHQTKTSFIAGEYQPHDSPLKAREQIRVAQFAEVQVIDKQFSLANYHGYHIPNPVGNETSKQKMQQVKDELLSMPGPHILSGDLNVDSPSAAMRVFDGEFTDHTAKHQVETTMSSLWRFKHPVACDHVLTNDGIKVTHFEVLDNLVSDHKALIAEFEI